MKNKKNDHIALPHSTLKRFREQGQDNFFYLDIKDKRIYERGPSVYQKKTGYYQKEFDDVCQRIETLMGSIHGRIDQLYVSNGGDFYTSEYLKSIAIDILALQTARRPELLENVTNPNILLERIDKIVAKRAMAGRLDLATAKTAKMFRDILDSPQKRRDYFYKTSFEEMKKIIINAGQMQDYSAIIHAIPNYIAATYLLTPYHYFIYKGCYLITLSPRYAIALMPNDAFIAMGLGEGMAIKVADENNVLKLIPAALEATSPCLQKHLIGERYILGKVLDFLGSEK